MSSTTIKTKYGTAKLNKKGYYHITNGEHQGKLLHRLIWEEHNGNIPKGKIIHHKDGNKRNNNPRNLQILNRGEHSALHKSTAYKKRGNRNINTLLKQYDKSYVPGERRSTEYDKRLRHKNMQKNNILLLHELNRELPETLQLNRCDIKIAETLVATFNNNLKYLHRQAKTEVIFLTFLFYIRKMENPRLKIEDYSILRKYGLTTPIYSLIISRVCAYYMMNTPISINETNSYDHDLLSKHNGV